MMNNKTRKQTLQHSTVAVSVALLASCAATQTAIEHRNLETSTKLSKTLFLEPVSQGQKTIYISMKNTSDEALDITKPLEESFKNKGYRIMNSPNQAHYLLQTNFLKLGKMSIAASQKALGGGFGSALLGAGTGASLGSFTRNGNAILAGGLAGGILSYVADSVVKEVNYTLITDVQISERVGKGVKIKEQFQSDLTNSSVSQIRQTLSGEGQYQRYRTRIVSNANQVNLRFENARAALEQGLVKTIAGIF